MKHILLILLACVTSISFAQEEDKAQLQALKKANNYVYQGNALAKGDDFISAEMAYRKAISEQPSSVTGAYNLGNSYYEKGNYEEALYRHQQAAERATSKVEKHKAFHNIGNILMKNEKYKEAVEAYKNALRNDPTDEETRYNLAVAKKKQKEQEDKQQEENKDDKDKKDEDKDNKDQKENEDKKENQDNKDQEGDDKEDKKDKGDEDEKKEDEGKPKDEKKDKGDDEKKKEEQKPKPQPGQLSPQQIKSLLEAMNNQEQKVQEKMNAEKQKGVKIKTDKDW
ncbi:hypothetical protein GCM10023314_05130 [Algibacter agarivorans]|uniref:Tetratricopeptide repeat protein n=1 Tax=Algibacter agarivorans TaxID=1109741 RepID=A0ABP9GAQ9_9FLAO